MRVGADGSLWHGDDDRRTALDQVDRGFADLAADVRDRATAPEAPAACRQWWSAEAAPAIARWADLVARSRTSWTTRTATEWSTYEDWIGRLRDLRSGARAHGLVLATPEPADLPKTAAQRAAAGYGSPVETWWTLGRALLYTVLGTLGLLSLHAPGQGADAIPDDDVRDSI